MTERRPAAASDAVSMRPLSATLIVGVGSVLTLAMSVISMKAYALLTGPDGVGLWALLQSILNIAVVAFGLGVSTSAITVIAAARAGGHDAAASAAERGTILFGITSGGLGCLLLILSRSQISEYVLGSTAQEQSIVWLAPGVLLSLGAAAHIGLLIARGLIREVTAINIGTAAAAAAAGIGLVAANGPSGFAPAIAATALVQFLLAFVVAHRHQVNAAPGRSALQPIRNLLQMGLPIATSQLLTTGAAFLIPIIVLQLIGQSAVGLYRAAAAFSVGYLTFFVAGLMQDFLPRLAAAEGPGELGVLVERRMRLVLGVATPVILALIAAGPWLLELLYTDQFRSSFIVMKWQLLGDLFRLPAWVLSYVLLARRVGRRYFAIELLAGVVLLATSFVGLRVGNLEGLGVGYLIAQGVYFVVVWVLVHQIAHTAPGRLQAVVAILVLVAAVAVAVVPPGPALAGSFGALACIIAAIAWPRLWRMHRAGDL